jgi:L-cysteine:1D-myo-inositol 2-amino-2-deoxy-alpha-D-glucopyranoside ligase
LALLAGHYRTDRPWTAQLLDQARGRLARWRSATGRDSGPEATATLAEVRACLADDLDTPGALSAVDRWAAEAVARGGRHPDAPALVRDLVAALLGVWL